MMRFFASVELILSAEAERSLKLFAKRVLPEFKKWQTKPLKDSTEFDAQQYAVA